MLKEWCAKEFWHTVWYFPYYHPTVTEQLLKQTQQSSQKPYLG